MAEEEPPAGGGRQLALRLPMWGWATVAGGVVAVLWFLRRRNSSASDSDANQPSVTVPAPTDIIPVSQGLAENQFKQLLDAIKALQGEESTPPPPDDNGPPTSTLPAPIHQPVPTPPRTPTPKPPAKDPTAHFSYKVTGDGESYSSIAKRYGHTGSELYAFQLLKGVRPASTQATIRSRGPNLLYHGSTVMIPSSWR